MAIAGVEEFSSDAMYDEDFAHDISAAGDVYTVEAVREILIKFIHSLEPDDLDSIGFMYGHNLNDKAKLMETGLVDEFMESDGE